LFLGSCFLVLVFLILVICFFSLAFSDYENSSFLL
jgi:hypothetical protein